MVLRDKGMHSENTLPQMPPEAPGCTSQSALSKVHFAKCSQELSGALRKVHIKSALRIVLLEAPRSTLESAYLKVHFAKCS